jgi:sirohydrochlorin ferrochelatase
VVICVHGIHGGLGSAARHVAAIAGLGRFSEVRLCCLNGQPALGDVLGRMRAETIYLVPLLMAEGYTLAERLRPALAGLPDDGKRVVVCRALGANPRLADVISEIARRTCRTRGWSPRETGIIVVGHGTPRCPNSGDTAIGHARRIARRGAFAEVGVAFLDQPPNFRDALAGIESRHVVVVGLFADRGAHGERDLLRLVSESGRDAAYAGPLGVSPEITEIILDQVEDARDKDRLQS